MRIRCRTNLDNVNTCEIWPVELDCVPRVGELIQSITKWRKFQLQLKVVQVTYKCIEYHYWYAEVELHIADGQPKSISEWQEWYQMARK